MTVIYPAAVVSGAHMLTLDDRLSMRARLEDTRTELERLRDEAPVGSDLHGRLDRMVDDANFCLRETGA